MLAKKTTTQPEFYINRLHTTISASTPVFSEEITLRNGRILLRDYLPIYANDRHCGHMFLYRDVTQERRVDVAKSEFMSLASHQLRTPLTSVRWALGRLGRRLGLRMDEDERHLLQSAKSAVTHMAHTIDTMLKISRIEAGKVSLRTSGVHVARIYQSVWNQFIAAADKQRLHVRIDCPQDSVLVTDANLLEEVLSNLINNAIKYTPPEGSIVLRCAHDHQCVYLEVEDTGFGIPLQQQKKIFTKFFRGENILKKHTDGTGLGLYLVFRLVGLLNGSISFLSEENKGTIFTVTLPLRWDARPSSEEQSIRDQGR